MCLTKYVLSAKGLHMRMSMDESILSQQKMGRWVAVSGGEHLNIIFTKVSGDWPTAAAQEKSNTHTKTKEQGIVKSTSTVANDHRWAKAVGHWC